MTSINRTGHRIPSVRKSCTKKQDTGTSPDGSGNSVPDTSRASETGTSRNKIPRKQTVHLQHVQKQETTAACVSFKNNRKKTDTVHKIYRVCVCTVLAETSPQALPLGAACIVSAIRHYFDRFPVPETTVQPELSVFSAESAPAADRIAALILAHHPQIVCFSLYVWNRPLLESVACIIKATAPGIILVAGGPEVTAGAPRKLHLEFQIHHPLEEVNIITDGKAIRTFHGLTGHFEFEETIPPCTYCRVRGRGALKKRQYEDGCFEPVFLLNPIFPEHRPCF